ncbi:hypothetical protein [Longimicrobium sp.]|uniref:hypothetical protein n=1 Tax=Longimicrobium sp. TaxID=2029185 RepID=UPI002B5C9E3A|nr:hypothetical protein [Longimicrobium sp.]HSU15064.1 hypothetical protein [Longimicrobium sp.]
MPYARVLALPLLALLTLAAGPSAAAKPPRTVAVRLTEYRIEMPDSVQQGEVTFSVTNAGHDQHQFSVRGHRGLRSTRVLKPGETVSFPMRLVVGGYTAYCNVREHNENHRQLGMEHALRVVW